MPKALKEIYYNFGLLSENEVSAVAFLKEASVQITGIEKFDPVDAMLYMND